ncbi:DNA cytosine methyltransferase [Brucella intermedia]|uniref:DNA cytosine methyltransferase n=1 Tax=Brucella intermedia TaxID=94625 RepID=UPI0021C92988|nr:DNA cytosine methyltransferase [Brucella intermedia]UXO85650.1 DNA cytosine methyltransferase [Brucella intermedia]
MTAYYNEFDPKAAAWLRELIKAGHIAPGDVDERSIVDIRPSDLIGYTQCHFFAGIGVWSYAFRRAGWPDDRPVWTGSCPCQPFSAAGKGAGFTDERHLWPHFHWLIENCRPPVVFGEQVAGKDGLGWLDLVQTDLEGSGYASGAVDTCAAGFGAPHIRQRIYWVGERLEHAEGVGRLERRAEPSGWRADIGCGFGIVGDARFARLERQRGGYSATFGHGQGSVRPVAEASEFGGVAHNNDDGCSAPSISGFHNSEHHAEPRSSIVGRSSPTNGFWRDADWLFCRDGKWRPVEPGTFPLAHGAAARVGRLRGYGNAIVAPAAQAFIEAYLESDLAAVHATTADNDNTSKKMAA